MAWLIQFCGRKEMVFCLIGWNTPYYLFNCLNLLSFFFSIIIIIFFNLMAGDVYVI